MFLHFFTLQIICDTYWTLLNYSSCYLSRSTSISVQWCEHYLWCSIFAAIFTIIIYSNLLLGAESIAVVETIAEIFLILLIGGCVDGLAHHLMTNLKLQKYPIVLP